MSFAIVYPKRAPAKMMFGIVLCVFTTYQALEVCGWKHFTKRCIKIPASAQDDVDIVPYAGFEIL